jgi:uncharacterized damage-inducible protein DinB
VLAERHVRAYAAPMTIAETFLPEFDAEHATTRRVLERVPEGRGAWKPHAKSMTLEELAGHLAQMPAWIAATLDLDVFDAEVHGARLATPPPPATTKELVARFDANVADGRAHLAAASDERMRGTWTMRIGGKARLSMVRSALMRGFILNHSIHHRGQLTVYLRMLDVALPSVYGPTADEML